MNGYKKNKLGLVSNKGKHPQQGTYSIVAPRPENAKLKSSIMEGVCINKPYDLSEIVKSYIDYYVD